VRIVRFTAGGKTQYGALEGPQIAEYTGTPFGPFRRTRRRHALRQVVLLSPVLPTKIVLAACNYRDRLAELGLAPPQEPVLFIKPPSTLVGPDDAIVVPAELDAHYEGELAAIVRTHCRNVSAERAREHVLGYTCLNDVTAVDRETKDGSHVGAKAHDTFCPVGPCIATDVDPCALVVETLLNGRVRQHGPTSDLVYSLDDLVARVSRIMTLFPGDIISTGTPAGPGPMVGGDKVEVRIDGIGTLCNPVVKLQA
jgi:2-keto-4-pentenoate hydratase/2-oxohepta-3-ene-1,7-dioic acid hydratase in catechol pathway